MLNLGFGFSIDNSADRKKASSYKCRIFDREFGSFVITDLNYKDIGNACMNLKNYIKNDIDRGSEFTFIKYNNSVIIKVKYTSIKNKFDVSVTVNGQTTYSLATKATLENIAMRGLHMAKEVQTNMRKERIAEGIYF